MTSFNHTFTFAHSQGLWNSLCLINLNQPFVTNKNYLPNFMESLFEFQSNVANISFLVSMLHMHKQDLCILPLFTQ